MTIGTHAVSPMEYDRLVGSISEGRRVAVRRGIGPSCTVGILYECQDSRPAKLMVLGIVHQHHPTVHDSMLEQLGLLGVYFAEVDNRVERKQEHRNRCKDDQEASVRAVADSAPATFAT